MNEKASFGEPYKVNMVSTTVTDLTNKIATASVSIKSMESNDPSNLPTITTGRIYKAREGDLVSFNQGGLGGKYANATVIKTTASRTILQIININPSLFTVGMVNFINLSEVTRMDRFRVQNSNIAPKPNDGIYKLADGIRAFDPTRYGKIGEMYIDWDWEINEPVFYKQEKEEGPSSSRYLQGAIKMEIGTVSGDNKITKLTFGREQDHIVATIEWTPDGGGATTTGRRKIHGVLDDMPMRIPDGPYGNIQYGSWFMEHLTMNSINSGVLDTPDSRKQFFLPVFFTQIFGATNGNTGAFKRVFKRVPFSQVTTKLSVLNQYKCLDNTLDTETVMTNGGEMVFEVTNNCGYDWIALSRCATNDVTVSYIDGATETEVSKKDLGWFDCCTRDNENCMPTIRREYPHLFKAIKGKAIKIKVKFEGKASLGHFFAGKTWQVPCISANFTRSSVDASEPLVEKLTAQLLLTNTTSLKSLVQTTLKVHYESMFVLSNYLPEFEERRYHLLYLLPMWYENDKLMEDYKVYGHSGVLKEVRTNNKTRTTELSFIQFSNTKDEVI